MILYGATRNIYNALTSPTGPLVVYGSIVVRSGPEEATVFPLYGAVKVMAIAPVALAILGAIKITKVAPTKFKLLGPLKTVRQAPSYIRLRGAIKTLATRSVNISGLNVSDIAQAMTLETPDVSYNIYPYLASDVKAVVGTELPYRIVEHDLLFDEAPAGPIDLVLFNRLQLYADEVRQLTVINTIPSRMDFSDVRVSGDFQFSLNAAGPWVNELTVNSVFYVKAPTLPAIGSDYTKHLTVTAVATPRG